MIIKIRRQSAPWKGVFMLSAVLVWGSSLAAGEAIPTNTVVARYSINPDALTEVVSSVGLVGALRASLMCDAAMPLDEELSVLMSGQIKDPVNGGPYPFLDSGLGFLVKSRDSIHGNLASVVRASHGDHSGFEDADWEEESAWNTLIEIVETGLTKSLAANGKFLRDSEGHVPLRVAGIRTVSLDELQTLEGGLEHIYLLLSPNTRFQSAMMADWNRPEGFGYAEESLLIELEPGEPPKLPSAVISVVALDRLAGAYEAQPGYRFTFRRDGDSLVATFNGEKGTVEGVMHPASETSFVMEIAGDRVNVDFTLGEDGKASGMALGQGGVRTLWARVD